MSSEEGNILDPCTLEGLPVSCYREWLQRRWEDTTKKAPAVRALDVYETLADCETVTADEIAPVVEAACSSYFVSWDIGLRFLCRLGARHEVARQAMRRLIGTGRAELRGRTLACVHDRLPKEFCIEMARQGLTDRSKGVRAVAAQVCLGLGLTEMLTELEAAAGAECRPETKVDLEWSIGLLRDAFFLYPRADGSQALVVRISDGVPLEIVWLGPPWCPESVTDRGEAKHYADEFRRLRGRTRRPFRWDMEGGEPGAGA
jgi:hypothetical protein